MKPLSATEIKWLYAAAPDEVERVLELPPELIRSLYSEVFKYGPRYPQVLRLSNRLRSLSASNVNSQTFPPELQKFMSEVGSEQLLDFYDACELMDINPGIQDSKAVQGVVLNLHELTRNVVNGFSNHGFFYVWASALCAIVGPDVYAGVRLEGFEQERAGIEAAAMEFIGLEETGAFV